MNTITVTQTFTQDDLKCVVCYEYLNDQIFQCPVGPHFVCGNCATSLNACPVCRHNSKLVRMFYLETELKKNMIQCKYNKYGCNDKIYSWDDEHMNICKYKPITCQYCNNMVNNNIESYVLHYKTGCNKKCDTLSINLKKNKFKCVLSSDNMPLIIEITKKYYIGIFPNKNNVEIWALAIDSKLCGQHINYNQFILVISDIIDIKKNTININNANNSKEFIFEDKNIPTNSSHRQSPTRGPEFVISDDIDMISPGSIFNFANSLFRNPFGFPTFNSSMYGFNNLSYINNHPNGWTNMSVIY